MGKNSAKPGIIVFVMLILGLIVAAVFQVAFDNEWILHLYVMESELPGLQIMTIVLFGLAGGIVAALSS